jgi:hypothetical protein
VEDDEPGETYWKVRHGIRFTGMPAYGNALTDTQLWQVTLFLANMNHLPPAANQLWHQMPSQSESEEGGPDERGPEAPPAQGAEP